MTQEDGSLAEEIQKRLEEVMVDLAHCRRRHYKDLHKELQARGVEIGYDTMYSYHREDRPIRPSLEYLIALRKAFRVSPEWLMTGKPPRTVDETQWELTPSGELRIMPLYLVGAPEEEQTPDYAARFEQKLRDKIPEFFELTATIKIEIQTLLMRYVYQTTRSTREAPLNLPFTKRLNFVVKVTRDLVEPWKKDRQRPWRPRSPEFNDWAKARIHSLELLWAPARHEEDTDA